MSTANIMFDGQVTEQHLRELLSGLTYNEHWAFDIIAHGGYQKTLRINVRTADSNPPHDPVLIAHQFPIPPIDIPKEEVGRWLFDCVLAVERHEACEHFRLNGVAPYYPEHGPGVDPYRVRRKL